MGKGFFAGKGNAISKDVHKGIDFCGFIAGFKSEEKLSSMDFVNWLVVSKKSGNFCYHSKAVLAAILAKG